MFDSLKEKRNSNLECLCCLYRLNLLKMVKKRKKRDFIIMKIKKNQSFFRRKTKVWEEESFLSQIENCKILEFPLFINCQQCHTTIMNQTVNYLLVL